MLESELSLLQTALRAVNESMKHTIVKLDRLHLALKASDPRYVSPKPSPLLFFPQTNAASA